MLSPVLPTAVLLFGAGPGWCLSGAVEPGDHVDSECVGMVEDDYTEEEPLVLPARLEEIRRFTPFWVGVLSPIQTFVSLLPSHKNSRRGRQAARRFKIVIGLAGLATIVFGAPNTLAVGGGMVLFLMTALPVPEVRKRGWQNRLRRLAGERTQAITRPARILYDGQQLTLDKEGSVLRRVEVRGDDHGVDVGRVEGRYYLRMTPASGEDSETIWIGTDGDLEESLPESVALTRFDDDAIERQCLLEPEDWRNLVELMRGTLEKGSE